MARNKPCRFTTAELVVLLEHLPDTERRLIVKLNHYAKSTIKKLCEEDKEQRTAASKRRINNLATYFSEATT
jgi:hypothetical protein